MKQRLQKIKCPKCNWTGSEEDCDGAGACDGCLFCPECGVEFDSVTGNVHTLDYCCLDTYREPFWARCGGKIYVDGLTEDEALAQLKKDLL